MMPHANTTHGMCHEPIYAQWRNMVDRCFNVKSDSYENYGGRGIRVCQRWLGADGFLRFVKDMGPKPGPDYSVDREDNDGDYSPDNCRWATKTEQNRNSRNAKLIECRGEVKCLAAWAEVSGVRYNAISRRLKKGWSAEDAIFTPSQIKKKRDLRQ